MVSTLADRVDGIWCLVFGGILLLSSCTASRVRSRSYSRLDDDDDDNDDLESGSGDASSTVSTLTQFESTTQLKLTDYPLIGAIVGCTVFLSIVIVVAVVIIVLLRKRRSLQFVSDGKASAENNYEARRPERRSPSDEARYTSLSQAASDQPSSAINGSSPVYDVVKLP